MRLTLNRSEWLVIGLCGTLLIAAIDYLTGIELSVSILYFFPIILVSWFVGPKHGIGLATLSGLLWAYVDHLGGDVFSSPFIFLFNAIVRLLTFLTISVLIIKLRSGTERAKKNELLMQKSYATITTSQQLTMLIAKNITQQNSDLWLWIVDQKKKGARIPEIVERTCRSISTNLASLSETSFSYQPHEKDPVDVTDLMAVFENKLSEMQQSEAEQVRAERTVTR